MDNASDDTITFNEKRECNYCTKAPKEIGTTTYFPGEMGEAKLKKTSMLKEEGKGKNSIVLWVSVEASILHIWPIWVTIGAAYSGCSY